MLAATRLSLPSEHEILVDYRSESGPTVTEVRGGLVVSTLDYLKSAGLFEKYAAELPPSYRDKVLYTIAASWIPVDVMMAHVDTLDRLAPSRAMQVEGGQAVGRTFGTMVYGALAKASRSVGSDPAWFVLKQSIRYYQRVYQGGGVTLIRTGPKDALLELHGLPMVRSSGFRASHHAYMSALFRLMTHSAYVKPGVPREPHPYCIATAFSWV